jgi:UDP-N-acetyl-D-galactosamine dehydrogenase
VDESTLAMSALTFTADPDDLRSCDVYIVAVPTPVDEARTPDFSLLERACEMLGSVITPGAIIVFESTVHPGATEEICGAVLQRVSGMKAGVDFKLAYSPERINPGDKAHPLEKIVKIVSAQDAETLEIVAQIYGEIIEAGVFRAPSIRVAEAAKVLENTQRDINIALMNEMSKICDLVGIRTSDVIEAAATKWNFHRFTPGLVGGHCIGVDPYYLTSKAQQLGYHPEVILAGRRINDGMGEHIASRMVQLISQAGRFGSNARIGVLGMTFKEDVPDIRNSRVIDLYKSLQKYGLTPLIHDPHADPEQTMHEYGIQLSALQEFESLDALVLAVPHRSFLADIQRIIGVHVSQGGLIIDIKAALQPDDLRSDLHYWSL